VAVRRSIAANGGTISATDATYGRQPCPGEVCAVYASFRRMVDWRRVLLEMQSLRTFSKAADVSIGPRSRGEATDGLRRIGPGGQLNHRDKRRFGHKAWD
jgi:hypothetical protein